MMDQTRKLTESYLNDPLNPHSLIVCVVSNRTERVRNSQAIELVQRYNKINSTIGVLTMVDLCKDTVRNRLDPYWELKQRLQGTSDDLPYLQYGYIALKNRDTVQSHTLADVNSVELQWLQENLPELPVSDITFGPNSEQSQTGNYFGIDSLIFKLLRMLDTYTETIWAKEELNRLHSERSVASTALKGLGLPVPTLPNLIEVVSKKFLSQVVRTVTYDSIAAACLELSNPKPNGLKASASYPSKNGYQIRLECYNYTERLAGEVIDSCIIKPITTIISDIFNFSIVDEASLLNHNLARYTAFHSVFVTYIMQHLNVHIKDKVIAKVIQVLDLYYTYECTTRRSTSTATSSGISGFGATSTPSPAAAPAASFSADGPFFAMTVNTPSISYIQRIIFDCVYMDRLTNPMKNIFACDTIDKTTFTDRLIKLHAEKRGISLLEAERSFMEESCADQRVQLKGCIAAYEAMIGGIDLTFPAASANVSTSLSLHFPFLITIH